MLLKRSLFHLFDCNKKHQIIHQIFARGRSELLYYTISDLCNCHCCDLVLNGVVNEEFYIGKAAIYTGWKFQFFAVIQQNNEVILQNFGIGTLC